MEWNPTQGWRGAALWGLMAVGESEGQSLDWWVMRWWSRSKGFEGPEKIIYNKPSHINGRAMVLLDQETDTRNINTSLLSLLYLSSTNPLIATHLNPSMEWAIISSNGISTHQRNKPSSLKWPQLPTTHDAVTSCLSLFLSCHGRTQVLPRWGCSLSPALQIV